MIPVLVRIPEWIPLVGGQPITSFGVALLAAFLVAGKLFVDALRAREPGARGWDLVVTAAVAGLLGAKALHLAVNSLLGLPTGLGRAGLEWFGGLAVGAGALLWHARRQGLEPAGVAAAAAAPAALGYAIGRLGSFLVGSAYGVPTSLPWGMTFPAGAPPTTPANLVGFFGVTPSAGSMAGDFARVHPTQLYEMALSLGVFAAVRRAGKGSVPRMNGWRIPALFLTLHGVARLAVEPLRAKADQLVGPISVDLLFAAGVTALGVWLWIRSAASNRQRDPT